MKRSEALEKIKHKLWILGVPDLSDYDAESLLSFIEYGLEMEPPRRVWQEPINSMLVTCEDNSWEPENA